MCILYIKKGMAKLQAIWFLLSNFYKYLYIKEISLFIKLRLLKKLNYFNQYSQNQSGIKPDMQTEKKETKFFQVMVLKEANTY